ncbi:MAG TPA: hypothetical protein VF483_02400 [Gemmatimonadaceae bacterium]
MRISAAAAAGLAAVFCSAPLAAQQAAAPTAPAIDFSGVLFGNYQFRTDSAAKAQTGGKSPNKFDVGRVYLTFRMPAGDKTSIRVTTDIFQQSPSAYYAGWTVRLKYGYINRELTKNLFGVEGLTANARVGMLHTVVVDHMENYWPRSLGTVGTETNGFFASSDVGAALATTLPNKRGEVYVTIVNGPNYSSGETDRFKDVAARVTLTPLANGTSLFKSLAISPWYSKGASASAFVLGGAGQVGPVSEGVQKDRRGLFVGLKDRRLTGGLDWAQRVEGLESGANTAGSPRVVTTRTSDLKSLFAQVRPMEWMDMDKPSPWGIVGRLDSFKIDNSKSASAQFIVLGAFWDVSAKTTFTLDLQQLSPKSGSTTVPAKTIFVHWNANF